MEIEFFLFGGILLLLFVDIIANFNENKSEPIFLGNEKFELRVRKSIVLKLISEFFLAILGIYGLIETILRVEFSEISWYWVGVVVLVILPILTIQRIVNKKNVYGDDFIEKTNKFNRKFKLDLNLISVVRRGSNSLLIIGENGTVIKVEGNLRGFKHFAQFLKEKGWEVK